MKWLKYLLFSTILLAICLVVFWFYGAPMNQEASYQLASKDVATFANENNIDLSQYDSPNQKPQIANPVYVFIWSPKHGGKSITAQVDPMKVRVTVNTK
jgi:hypothetical protein